MAFHIHDDLMDNGPQYLKDECTLITVVSADPTLNYTQATVTYKLADVVVDTSDFTVSDGDTSGRKVVQAAITDVMVDTSGTATHLCFCDSGASKVLMVKPITSQAITSGNTMTIPENKWEVLDPSPV